MIVWLNGAFGVGKTTTSQLITADGAWRHFDPEWVGYMLANNLSDHAVTDFQQYPSWRRLVPIVADEIIQFTGQHLMATQSVLVEEYWREITKGLADLGHDVFHVVLDADAQTLHERIGSDQDEPERTRAWRHQHAAAYHSALAWLRPAADLVIDTGHLDAAGAADRVRTALETRL